MKRSLCLFAALLCAVLVLLSACGTEETPAAGANESSSNIISGAEETPAAEATENSCKIMSVTDSSVTALIYDHGLAVFSLPEDVSFESGLGDELKPGMTTDITCTDVRETYPLQVDVQSVHVSGYDDGLVSLYFDILEELIEDIDSGLSDQDEEYFGFDFSGLENLTQEERDAIAWTFASQHGRSPVFGSVSELGEQGYIDMDNLYWEEGTAISLNIERSSGKKFSLACEKWKSGLGAVGYTIDCRNYDGVWTAGEKDGFWIS